jgi:diguanylate cyclase (GGDEF)-like protein
LDPVTQVHRAQYLSVVGPQLIAAAGQNQSPLCLLILQIENFRQIVNLYGWHIGDVIMQKTAELARAELRETDVITRYGCQGFVALLPGVRAEQASRCAQRLQQQLRALAIANPPGTSISVTCQTAIASYPEHGTAIQDLLLHSQTELNDHIRSSAAASGDSISRILEFPPRG